MDTSTSDQRTGRLRWVLCIAAIAYVFVFALTFSADPLGQVPVLDARENIAWATMIRADALPAEPMYRALLYPWILAKLPTSHLALAATFLGAFCHLVSACLAGLIAARLWASRSAAYISGLLYAVYPVALYFSAQVLDITFSTTLFLAAVYGLICLSSIKQKWLAVSLALLVGVIAGLAVAARPNFLPAVLCLPIASLFFAPRSVLRPILIAVGLGCVLGGQGLVNQKLSSEFRILPWQGAYNIYAANREGANGKFYMQQIAFDEVPAGSNTTRMESELLYQHAVQSDGPGSVKVMGDFWSDRLRETIADDPLRWLGLMARKALYLLNDWEQYNNLTYAYHKARWPLLAANPLGWGVLLIAAYWGLSLGARRVPCAGIWAIALLGLAYAAGLLLFFVSARFRLPLAPLLCVAVGGLVYWKAALKRREYFALAGGCVLLASVSFGGWYGARDRTSFIQDELLLAKASSEVGDDLQALSLARAVLERDPNRVEAQRIEATSLFNRWLVRRDSATWAQVTAAVGQVDVEDASVAFIRGVVLWLNDAPGDARAYWQTAVAQFGDEAGACRDALLATEAGAAIESTGRVRSIRALLGL